MWLMPSIMLLPTTPVLLNSKLLCSLFTTAQTLLCSLFFHCSCSHYWSSDWLYSSSSSALHHFFSGRWEPLSPWIRQRIMEWRVKIRHFFKPCWVSLSRLWRLWIINSSSPFSASFLYLSKKKMFTQPRTRDRELQKLLTHKTLKASEAPFIIPNLLERVGK